MMEVKDQAIKLFGKKIALPEENHIPFFSSDCAGAEKDDGSEEHSGNGINSKTSTESDENSPKTPSIGEVSNQINNGKTLKKPDKILPCPRCSSMDTKFCYYNNYNVNQPRHFCKSCQRYWTAGGTMRNVPVGAGRRKNKTFASILNHISTSNSLPNAPTTKTNATNATQNENNYLGGIPCVPWAIPYFQAPYWGYNMNLYSSNLGKHSREGGLIKGCNNEQKIEESSILVPKTLRIDDLDEAAKSSIWETLGIKNDCINREGLFKSFERKGDEKSHSKTVTSPALQANPAAMSRSLDFQERV